jgi:hypothetical protein
VTSDEYVRVMCKGVISDTVLIQAYVALHDQGDQDRYLNVNPIRYVHNQPPIFLISLRSPRHSLSRPYALALSFYPLSSSFPTLLHLNALEVLYCITKNTFIYIVTISIYACSMDKVVPLTPEGHVSLSLCTQRG